ncbi:uncharacterized protein LOC135843828 [Planococcus citri]|uniref:uncharacterized protein LOC135843828 n=1 Tax=Planococcus citri TaxID=170843 RepID=UPI0031F9A5D4
MQINLTNITGIDYLMVSKLFIPTHICAQIVKNYIENKFHHCIIKSFFYPKFQKMIFIAGFISTLIYSLTVADNFQHSSTGDYRVEWKEFAPCPPEKRGTNEVFTDIHLTKRHQGLTEIVGKTILLIPFDDNITVNVNFNILGSNSAWLPNAYHLPVPKACSSMIRLLGEGWVGYMKNMGMVPKCPVPKGVYELKGYDVNNMIRGNVLPKEFIYGRYKIIIEYVRSGKLVGCVYTIIQAVPAWQRKTKKNDHSG